MKRLGGGGCVISNAAVKGNSSTQDRHEVLYGRRRVRACTAEGPKLRDSAVKVDERGMDKASGYYTCMGSSALPRLGASSSRCKTRRSSSRLRERVCEGDAVFLCCSAVQRPPKTPTWLSACRGLD